MAVYEGIRSDIKREWKSNVHESETMQEGKVEDISVSAKRFYKRKYCH